MNTGEGMYSTIFRNIIFPVMEFGYGTNIQQYLAELNKTQWLPRKELEEFRNKKLRMLINHACRNVPYYHKKFRELNIRPEDIRSGEDLSKLPILTKEIIRNNLPELIARNIDKASIMERRSSGSTGEPLKYYMDKKDYSYGWAQTFRCWGWAGYRPGDPYVKITHPRSTTQRKIQDRLMNCALVPAFEINEKNVNEIADRIKRTRPLILRGFPSSVYLLTTLLEKKRINGLNVKAVMTTGDTLFPHHREHIESQLNCQVFDAYGGEGTPVGYECEKHEGYHVCEEGVIVEFINHRGEICSGDIGEIAITNLTNFAMPLIRYNIQDIGRQSGEPCSCGRSLSLIKSIEGRSTDIIITPGGRLLTVHFFSTFLKHVEGIDQYQIVQENKKNIIFKIVRNNGFNEKDTDYIKTECRRRIGEEMEIEVEAVEEIPLLSSGKRRFVISKVPLEL